ncbi:MAG: hypothetical protein ABIT83_09975 [Massilia sp.]
MNTLHLAHIFPQAVSKLFWMRVNRALAWSLIFSPPLQWALHMPFVTGLGIDLAILLAHAAMSFALFGKPETRERVFNAGMHLLGFRAGGMSERNRFLLSGYRIALGAIPIALLASPLKYDATIAAVVLVYPLLRLQLTVIQHIYLAVRYALRRWGMREDASGGALAIVIAYVLVSFINMVR